MGLEEERLARNQDAELTAPAGLPEVHLPDLWAGRKEPVPVVVGHTHVRAHNRYCAPAPSQPPGNPAITPPTCAIGVSASRRQRARRRALRKNAGSVRLHLTGPAFQGTAFSVHLLNFLYTQFKAPSMTDLGRVALAALNDHEPPILHHGHIRADRCIDLNDHGRSRGRVSLAGGGSRLAVVVTVAKGYDLGYIWKTQGDAAAARDHGRLLHQRRPGRGTARPVVGTGSTSPWLYPRPGRAARTLRGGLPAVPAR